MLLRQSTAVRVPFRLVDSTGASVPGMVASDFTNGTTTGHCSVVKADGTITDISLVLNTNLFEIDATKAPGLYHLLVPSGATAVIGELVVVLLPAAADFIATYMPAQVDAVLLDSERARKCTYNNYEVVTAGGDANRAIVYEDDGTTVFKKYDLKDSSGSPTTTNPFQRVGL